MFNCADCADDDCEEHGRNPHGMACDNFTQEMYDENPVSSEFAALNDLLIGYGKTLHLLEDRMNEQERRLSTIIAAVIRASGDEVER